MKKFVALYRSAGGHQQPPQMSPEETAAMMKPWADWKEKFGERVIDMGAPFAPGTESNDGAGWKPTSHTVTGFSIVAAESLEGAQQMFEGHPIYSYPDHSVEICECAPM